VVEATRVALRNARRAYLALEYREVVRLAAEVASLCNRRMQEGKPWEAPTSDASRRLLFTVVKALNGIAVILAPILPVFSEKLTAAFGQPDPRRWPEDLDPFAGPPVVGREKPPQIARIDAKQVAQLIVVPAGEPAAPQPVAKSASPAETATRTSAKAAPAPAGVIQYEDFARLELRVGVVKSAEVVPKADKLLKLSVDVGEESARTLVAGIAQAYPDPAVLVGKRIVVVANLAPRPLRGITSQGMLLAAGEPPNLQVVTVGDAIPAGTRVK
jgi:methionyl-tRNA synthetase